MESYILNRLLAAKDIITSSGPSLGAFAPASLVGRKLLAAHDAAELVLLALSSLPGAAPLDGHGRVQRDPPFIKLAEAVCAFADNRCGFEAGPAVRVFEDLLEARKLFKHSGMLVDPLSNAPLFGRTISILDSLCSSLLNESLSDVNVTSSVTSDEIRAEFEVSKTELERGDYKASLESTARALAQVFWTPRTPVSPTAGKPSAEEALLLSGKGIDPSSFLAMQQSLPLTYHTAGDARWKLREYGHPSNWTYDSAAFCLRTAIDAAIKLQGAAVHPLARDFYNYYQDAVTVVTPEPEVYHVMSGVFARKGNFTRVSGFLLGDEIFGRARCHIQLFGEANDDLDESLPYSEWLSVDHPDTSRMTLEPESVFRSNSLWFKKSEVELSYRIDPIWEKLREEE